MLLGSPAAPQQGEQRFLHWYQLGEKKTVVKTLGLTSVVEGDL